MLPHNSGTQTSFKHQESLAFGGHLEVSRTTWPTAEIKMQVRLQELPILPKTRAFVLLTMKPRVPLVIYSEICFKLRMHGPVVIDATEHMKIEKGFETKKNQDFGDHQRSVETPLILPGKRDAQKHQIS